MRPGQVVQIRISPQDCLSILDVVSAIKVVPPGVSFSQMVSIALSSALESFRQNGVIPTRTGEEYAEMMRPHIKQNSKATRARALAITETFRLAGSDTQVPPIIAEPPDRRRRRLRYDELMFRRSADPSNFSHSDLEELVPLINEFQPGD